MDRGCCNDAREQVATDNFEIILKGDLITIRTKKNIEEDMEIQMELMDDIFAKGYM